MAIIDTFKANTTSVEFSWPADLSGLERIMLSAHGDLQRLLSAFFSNSINIKTIYAHTSPRTHTASPEEPITQGREVHLICNGKTACIATSTVTITTPEMFRKMQTPPKFALLECGSKFEAGKRVLWRRYTLSTDGFLCDIVEVFPDRDMFVQGEQWLSESPETVSSQESNHGAEESKRRYSTSTVLLTV
ncbi:hypothetical protein BGY98DRAFT_1181748 [Russula aff. rugulosa BPL654]|nr:hypothetical protein BGY98DRAFT_1181748 [Russula aff. rugulosa BPL654]